MAARPQQTRAATVPPVVHPNTVAPDLAPEFGQFALHPLAERLRRVAEHVPRRWMASALRRIILLGREVPCDVPVFGTQRARLHPADNRAEKRVLAGPQFWDAEERRRLAADLQETPEGQSFCFVDAGANVGLYTLSLRADAAKAGTPLCALAIECDPINGARLAFNLEASDAREVTQVASALSDTAGTLHFQGSELENRGEARVVDTAGATTIEVEARPLYDVLRDAGFSRIDAMKMDIEGHEIPVLTAFFATAPVSLWPRLVVLETGRAPRTKLLDLMQSSGYRIEQRIGINTILTLLPERAMSESDNVEA